METVLCSLSECGDPILGSCIVLAPQDPDVDLQQSGMLVYDGVTEGIPTQWVMLHPNCCYRLIDEILRQESQSALGMFVGPVGDIREALEIA